MKRVLVFVVAAVAVLGLTAPSAAAARSKKPPTACIKALDAGEELASLGAEFMSDVSSFFAAMGASAQANNTGTLSATNTFLVELGAHTEKLTSATNTLQPQVAQARSTFDTYADKCRRGR